MSEGLRATTPSGEFNKRKKRHPCPSTPAPSAIQAILEDQQVPLPYLENKESLFTASPQNHSIQLLGSRCSAYPDAAIFAGKKTTTARHHAHHR